MGGQQGPERTCEGSFGFCLLLVGHAVFAQNVLGAVSHDDHVAVEVEEGLAVGAHIGVAVLHIDVFIAVHVGAVVHGNESAAADEHRVLFVFEAQAQYYQQYNDQTQGYKVRDLCAFLFHNE